MGLPEIEYPHKCPQSKALVDVIEDQRATIERQRQAIEFHRQDALEAKTRLKDAEIKLETMVRP